MADWDRMIAANRQQGLAAARYNRELVLRYPDIAKRLTEPPLKLAEPRQWTGYAPGPYLPEDVHGRTRPNPSPVRVQLLEILHAAAERADSQNGVNP